MTGQRGLRVIKVRVTVEMSDKPPPALPKSESGVTSAFRCQASHPDAMLQPPP